jgi:hypothetical protein
MDFTGPCDFDLLPKLKLKETVEFAPYNMAQFYSEPLHSVVYTKHIVTHSRYAEHPPPVVFLHAVPSRAEVSRSEPSRAEAH